MNRRNRRVARRTLCCLPPPRPKQPFLNPAMERFMNQTFFASSLVLALSFYLAPQPSRAAHTHPSAGPHGGEILELGDEEYHAELLLDEKHDKVTVYVLDGTAKQDVAIQSKFLNVNVKSAGRPLQFKLPAVPTKGQPEGRTSCFSLKDAKLMTALHEHGSN